MNLEDFRIELAALLQDTPFAGKVYFAGGCVRDYLSELLFGRQQALTPQSDIDITVEIENGGIRLAEYLLRSLNAVQFVSFPAFGTAKLRYSEGYMEFVATRKEQYRKDSRYPLVSYGTLQDDVLRRDFTINALLMDITTGEFIDLTELGMNDLKDGIIRCVGDPVLKFREDPLRLLRALRFSLRFGFKLEPETYEAMRFEGNAIDRLSKSCIKKELDKMLMTTPKQDLLVTIHKLRWYSKRLDWMLKPY